MMINKYGIIVESLLKEKGITKYKMAKDLGISKSALTYYCNEKMQPTADVIIITARYFDVTTDYILGVEDEAGRKVYINNSFNGSNNKINL